MGTWEQDPSMCPIFHKRGVFDPGKRGVFEVSDPPLEYSQEQYEKDFAAELRGDLAELPGQRPVVNLRSHDNASLPLLPGQCPPLTSKVCAQSECILGNMPV
eukprot:1183447-Prorocentrum_minimum.AAC.3